MRLALYQPDIPQNTGTLMRLCAAMDVPLDIIEPCGFALDEKKIRRAAMDYIDHLDMTRHTDWAAFQSARKGRLILMTTKSDNFYTDVEFQKGDVILMGRESVGAPDEVHEVADVRLRIPMRAEARSLNMAVSASMVLGEALRQTKGFPI